MYELLNTISNGFLFGFWDNGIVVGGILLVAWIAGRRLACPVKRAEEWKKAVGLAFVGSLSNALSDFIGAIGDPTMWSNITGITAGCLFWSAILVLPRTGLIVTRNNRGVARA